MGWRFRKYIKVAPGVKLNISKSGVSTTFGGKGASINFGKDGAYINTSIPGTGWYNRKKIFGNNNSKTTNMPSRFKSDTNEDGGFFTPRNTWGCVFRWLGIIGIIYLFVNLFLLLAGKFDNSESNKQALWVWGVITALFVVVYLNKILTFFHIDLSRKKYARMIEELVSNETDETRKAFLCGLATEYSGDDSEGEVCIDEDLNEKQRDSFKKLYSAFKNLCKSDKIWIILSRTTNTESKSSVSHIINRREVRFSAQSFNNVVSIDTQLVPTLNDGINTGYYIYPSCIVKAKGETDFEITPIEKVNIRYDTQTFIENSSSLPNDAKFVKHTYRKVNKDGTPDLRFANNKKLPVYLYGKIFIDGVGFAFMVSNASKAKAFVDAFIGHKATMSSMNLSKKTVDSKQGNRSISKELVHEKLGNLVEDTPKKDNNASKVTTNQILDSQIISVVKLLLQDNHVTPRYLSEKTGIDINLMLPLLKELENLSITDNSGLLLIHNESELGRILLDRNKKDIGSYKTGNKEQVEVLPNEPIKAPIIFLPSGEKPDPLFYDAAKMVVQNQRASTSLIQREFAIGYHRALRLFDLFECAGIVSSFDGIKPRKVLIKDELSLNNKLSELSKTKTGELNASIKVDDKDIIPRSLYEEVNDNVNAFKNFINELLGDKAFMSKYEDSQAKVTQRLHLLVVKDILTSFRELGHTLAIESVEGQCVLQTYIYLAVNKMQDYNEFKALLTFNTPEIINARKIIQDNLYDYEKTQMILVPGELNLITLLRYNKDLAGKYLTLLYRYMVMIVKSDNEITEQETTWLNGIIKLREAIMDSPAQEPIKSDEVVKPSNLSSQQTINKNPVEELSNLIGLANVKTEVNNLYNLVKVQKMRESSGMKKSNISYHCVFTGNPGTGKTTVARIVAKIYKDLGVIKKGHLVETDRSGLVGEYVGQTAPKTNTIIDSALDGVLFIDEAYSLVQGGQNDYGKEAISTLLKRMEDDRNRLIVILAGYSKEMEDFINSNSGLQSRFNRYIEFPDYTSNELIQIFNYVVKKNEYDLSEEASIKIKAVITDAVEHKDMNFGNARYVRNLFEKIITQQANRITAEPTITKEMLAKIEELDIINAVKYENYGKD